MHDLAYRWVADNAEYVPANVTVLEVGSLDVNGSTRGLFPSCTWTGVDLLDGPGVDVVADAADWDPGHTFDAVVCTEALEHTPRAAEVVANIGRLLRPGGVLIVTCAGPGREPHAADGTGPPHPGEFYANVHPADLEDWLIVAGFDDSRIDLADGNRDLRCVAWR